MKASSTHELIVCTDVGGCINRFACRDADKCLVQLARENVLPSPSEAQSPRVSCTHEAVRSATMTCADCGIKMREDETGNDVPEKGWRVGRKLGRTIYLNGVCVGLVDTPEIASMLVTSATDYFERAMGRSTGLAHLTPEQAAFVLKVEVKTPSSLSDRITEAIRFLSYAEERFDSNDTDPMVDRNYGDVLCALAQLRLLKDT